MGIKKTLLINPPPHSSTAYFLSPKDLSFPPLLSSSSSCLSHPEGVESPWLLQYPPLETNILFHLLACSNSKQFFKFYSFVSLNLACSFIKKKKVIGAPLVGAHISLHLSFSSNGVFKSFFLFFLAVKVLAFHVFVFLSPKEI